MKPGCRRKGHVQAVLGTSETPAILAFIAQSFPGAGLAPSTDPFAFAPIQAFNSYLYSTLHVSHAHRLRPNRWADDPAAMEEMRRKVPDLVGSCFEHIENELLNGPWVMGEAYTICDPYLFTVAQWMKDPARFPNVADHRRRMFERKSVQNAVAAGFV